MIKIVVMLLLVAIFFTTWWLVWHILDYLGRKYDYESNKPFGRKEDEGNF